LTDTEAPEALEQLWQKLKRDVGRTDAGAEGIIAAHAQDHGQSPAS
jgi:hypothetical protein